VVRVRSRQHAIEDLLSWMPKLGLILETCQLMEAARDMERRHKVGSGAVTEFDELFKVGYRSIVEALVTSSRTWHQDEADDALSQVAYDKGAWFLQFLEERFGREAFDAFLRGYFDHFAFQSITTETFLDYAKKNLFAKYPGKVSDAEIQEWVYGPGIPANAPQVLSPRFGIVDSARLGWRGSKQLPPAAITSQWTTQEWLHFLEGMPETLPVAELEQLDNAYHFTGTANGEIAMRWYPLAIRSGYVQANEAISAFVQRIGRRKLIMPVYSALVQTEPGLALAKDAFAKARPGYHPITTGSVEKVIAEAKPAPVPQVVPAPAVDADGVDADGTAPEQGGGAPTN